MEQKPHEDAPTFEGAVHNDKHSGEGFQGIQRYEPQETGIITKLACTPKEAAAEFKKVDEFIDEVLQPERHYFEISNQKSLNQDGARVLGRAFNVSPQFFLENSTVVDWSKPLFSFDYRCELYSRTTGIFIGSGVGNCNSLEEKYRYRWVEESKLPNKYSKEDFDPATEIRDYYGKIQYRIENDDIFSIINTMKKIAKKRAYVDGISTITGASSIKYKFTQDLEDLPESYRQESSFDANAVKCSVCGKDMKKRSGRDGDFYGCSGFPNCRNTMQIDEYEKALKGSVKTEKDTMPLKDVAASVQEWMQKITHFSDNVLLWDRDYLKEKVSEWCKDKRTKCDKHTPEGLSAIFNKMVKLQKEQAKDKVAQDLVDRHQELLDEIMKLCNDNDWDVDNANAFALELDVNPDNSIIEAEKFLNALKNKFAKESTEEIKEPDENQSDLLDDSDDIPF